MPGIGPRATHGRDDGCGAALASLDGPWMAFGLLPQIDWAKCAAGNLLGVIPFD
jgi:hypothetical protein